MATQTVAREQAIREEFCRVGGLSMAAFARHCMAIGLFTFEERDAFELRGAMAIVRRALKKPDESGLPLAGQTTFVDEDGAPIWQPRQLWLFEDYQLNYADAWSQADVLIGTAERIADECQERFGRRPARA